MDQGFVTKFQLPLLPQRHSSWMLEQFEAVGGDERVQRNVPLVCGNLFAEPLHGPADPDQAGAILLEAGKSPVIMALAAPDACAMPVNSDQWNENEVRLNHRMAPG